MPKHKSLHQDHRLLNYVVGYLFHQKQYQLIVEAIETQEKPSILIPGTLGAYLFGCLLPTYGDSSKECSPLCIGSVPTPGINVCKDCDKQVWVLRRYNNWVSYIKVNQTNGSQGIIYVDTKFNGFHSYDIDKFSSYGMKRATIMDTTSDGHHTINNECPLSALPMQNGETAIVQNNDDDDDRTAFVVLISVLIVLIIIFVIWAVLYH